MTTFGTSAYLRLLLLNPRPMETAIKSRIIKSNKEGRDFHASLRSSVKRYIINPLEKEQIQKEFEDIKSEPERASAKQGFKKATSFLERPGTDIYSPESKIFEHPSGRFAVKFQPNFGVQINGKRLAVHLWNTKSPALTERGTKALLALFINQFDENEFPIILCLKTMRMFGAGVSSYDRTIAYAFAERVDALIEKYVEVEALEEKRASKS